MADEQLDYKNKVELLGWYGGDMSHSLSGWTSTHRELTQERIERIPAFLKQLADGSDGNPHSSPFEKSAIHFLVTCEAASHIHILKHRIGVSVNGESARYKELGKKEGADRYYIPNDWPEEWKQTLLKFNQGAYEMYHKCLDALVASGMSRKRAKESARFFIPYAGQLRLDVMFNFRSFEYFLRLRAKDGAQDEIHSIADEMLKLVRDTGDFEHSLNAFGL